MYTILNSFYVLHNLWQAFQLQLCVLGFKKFLFFMHITNCTWCPFLRLVLLEFLPRGCGTWMMDVKIKLFGFLLLLFSLLFPRVFLHVFFSIRVNLKLKWGFKKHALSAPERELRSYCAIITFIRYWLFVPLLRFSMQWSIYILQQFT